MGLHVVKVEFCSCTDLHPFLNPAIAYAESSFPSPGDMSGEAAAKAQIAQVQSNSNIVPCAEEGRPDADERREEKSGAVRMWMPSVPTPKSMDTMVGSYEVLKVKEDEIDACPVHGVALRRGQVPVVYGLPVVEDEYLEAQKLFPFANEEIGGGCLIGYDDPKLSEVKYCAVCRREQAKWRRERRKRKRHSASNHDDTDLGGLS